jgi:hypothetical protein
MFSVLALLPSRHAAVFRALAGAENSIEKCGSSSTRPKHPEGSFKVVNALAMAASYDPDPTESLDIRLPVTFDTCEVIEDRWVNLMRQDPVARSKLRRIISARRA